jgi:hypothetical protein
MKLTAIKFICLHFSAHILQRKLYGTWETRCSTYPASTTWLGARFFVFHRVCWKCFCAKWTAWNTALSTRPALSNALMHSNFYNGNIMKNGHAGKSQSITAIYESQNALRNINKHHFQQNSHTILASYLFSILKYLQKLLTHHYLFRFKQRAVKHIILALIMLFSGSIVVSLSWSFSKYIRWNKLVLKREMLTRRDIETTNFLLIAKKPKGESWSTSNRVAAINVAKYR